MIKDGYVPMRFKLTRPLVSTPKNIPCDRPRITGILHFIFGIKGSFSRLLDTANSLITFTLFEDAIAGLSRMLTSLRQH